MGSPTEPSSGLRPRLHDGVYAFVCVPRGRDWAGLDVVSTMMEPEGQTLVVPEQQALARGLEVRWRGRWITLEAPTELSLVGLTARFATALAEEGIACNVVAGAHHDHLFVPPDQAARACDRLSALAL